MSNNTPLNEQAPTLEELRKYLMDDNGWTQEEFDQFTGYYFRGINADGTTSLSRDQWSFLAMGFE
ncbi:hypothetical protein PBI_MARTIN_57 [Microbacterium phage Martin]|uniref:Uncharacterized protein n=63 Tax=Ilzatvirus TaxID=2560150 RepID=A0A345KZW4_9CAUD|nr:hypothetical protein FDJ36_gp55 [Microbacterium phage Ilzat]YP_009908758.1 hypothetical protein H3N90_gp56 [Microbacterium phage Teagan]AUX82642.1 hypothetical protein PBI_AUBERGINE_55 [Microbacterium phage Aubergine]AUX82705.1 hypothetical protein PBI_AXIPUP_56 [Microbacterium phage AxiPup]AUX82767.1 hypothetical protein PBI_BAINES_55 [Microbacterium phage Baines]AUX82829.1 hypothetical protein PBI_ESPINOSA_55 [Microbacterium phage Espinosa]AUX82954.1 hypothetical protein PBI_KALE_55 [Mic